MRENYNDPHDNKSHWKRIEQLVKIRPPVCRFPTATRKNTGDSQHDFRRFQCSKNAFPVFYILLSFVVNSCPEETDKNCKNSYQAISCRRCSESEQKRQSRSIGCGKYGAPLPSQKHFRIPEPGDSRKHHLGSLVFSESDHASSFLW